MRDFLASDLPTINAWHRAHGQTDMTAEMVPSYGAIEPGIAAGFLYRTDAYGVAHMDLFVTNPEAPLFARYRAIEDAIQWLTDRAKEDGVKHIIAAMTSRSLTKITRRLGFTDNGMFRVMLKEVT